MQPTLNKRCYPVSSSESSGTHDVDGVLTPKRCLVTGAVLALEAMAPGLGRPRSPDNSGFDGGRQRYIFASRLDAFACRHSYRYKNGGIILAVEQQRIGRDDDEDRVDYEERHGHDDDDHQVGLRFLTSTNYKVSYY
ncbi:unnamed protein product [Phytophthora fragariaefolia]|uniref:Unnamed protein product n=1 Tax=Phytophthora fragariaefolia TaxID=1490495 RepID=A0A9W7DB53_9STRA|nr:unnamed protein product [Phytophthora fragariaefolia]